MTVGKELSQLLCYFADVVFLEEANSGDAGGTSVQTCTRVFQCDSADGQHRHPAQGSRFRVATAGAVTGASQAVQTKPLRSADLLEDRPENGKIGAVGFGQADLFGGVAGNSNHDVARSTFHALRKDGRAQCAGVRSWDVVGRQVDAVGACGQGYVRSGIDEKSGLRFRVSRCTNDANSFAGELFEFAARQILFPKLDVMYSRANGMCDIGQQPLAALKLRPGKLSSVGDVVERQED